MIGFLAIIAAYLIGSIPFSHIFPLLLKGHDIRQQGTGNVGATNALIVSGKLPALLALAGDIGKGILVIILARSLGLPDRMIALSGLAAVVGHDFSLFLGFRGGKGVATAGGVLLGLDPVFAILVMLLWFLIMLIWRYFIPSTVLALCLVPALMWMGFWRPAYIFWFGVLNALLAIWAHRANLKLFFAGQELTIQESMAKHLKK